VGLRYNYVLMMMDHSRGQSGVVLMKGPQMMAGYKSNPEATRSTIDTDGFLNTGDLGRFNPGSKQLIITGERKWEGYESEPSLSNRYDMLTLHSQGVQRIPLC